MAWLNKGTHEEWLFTVVGLAALCCAYVFAKGYVAKQKDWDLEQKRSFTTQVRNLLWVGVGFVIIMSWSKTLFPFLFSIVAILVAFVMATKEWITCIMGAMYRMTTRSFKIGDHISIQNVRGEVLDVQWLQTRMLELGPEANGTYYTGRVVSIPNSWLIQYQLSNETFFDTYGFHWIALPLSVYDDVQMATEILVEQANLVCADFMDDAKKNMTRMQDSHFVDGPTLAPKTHLEFKEMGQLKLNLRFPAPHGRGDGLSQKIIQNFLKIYTPAVPKEWTRGKLNIQS